MSQSSGRFVLRMTPAMHRRLRDRAREGGMSLNSLCLRLLEAGLEDRSVAPVAIAAGVDTGLLEAVEREWAGELVGIVFFGSAARGRATETSDVDLLLVLEPDSRIERRLYDRWDGIVRSRGRSEDRRVSPQFAALPGSAADAGGIWLEAAREGIVLVDRDGRLARFIIALRDLIAGGGVTRRTVHGHPYWVREGGSR